MNRSASLRLNWLTLLPLEVGFSVAIIGVCAAICASRTAILQEKARMTEVLTNASNARVSAMEQFSVQGQLATPESGIASTAEADREFSYRYSGSRLDASGALRKGGLEFRLSMTPAVKAEDGWSVIWLCGQRKAPAGWATAAPALSESLTAEELPYVCRDTRVE